MECVDSANRHEVARTELNATFNGIGEIYELIFPLGRLRSPRQKFLAGCVLPTNLIPLPIRAGVARRPGRDLTKIHVLVCPSSITW